MEEPQAPRSSLRRALVGDGIAVAKSPAHKLGQIIGDELEAVVRGPLQEMAEEFGLYLDYKHPRPVRDGKKKVAWRDSYDNVHDLDYVLEEEGGEKTRGRPRAFIETAWRRYTKHSRNKAQEIQGAILPLAETYGRYAPFLGAVLAGDFTEGSRDQLRSHGFQVAYITYETIVQAFENLGVDVSSNEDTPEAVLNRKVEAFERLQPNTLRKLREQIHAACAAQLDPFFDALRNCLGRRITQITMLALSGTSTQFEDVESAIRFVEGYDESMPPTAFDHYELNVRYSNGREVQGSFPDKKDCIDFLRLLRRA